MIGMKTISTIRQISKSIEQVKKYSKIEKSKQDRIESITITNNVVKETRRKWRPRPAGKGKLSKVETLKNYSKRDRHKTKIVSYSQFTFEQSQFFFRKSPVSNQSSWTNWKRSMRKFLTNSANTQGFMIATKCSKVFGTECATKSVSTCCACIIPSVAACLL